MIRRRMFEQVKDEKQTAGKVNQPDTCAEIFYVHFWRKTVIGAINFDVRVYAETNRKCAVVTQHCLG